MRDTNSIIGTRLNQKGELDEGKKSLHLNFDDSVKEEATGAGEAQANAAAGNKNQVPAVSAAETESAKPNST